MPHHSVHRNYFQRLLWFSFTLAALTCWGSVPSFAACDVLAFRPTNIFLIEATRAVVKDINNDGKLDVVTNGAFNNVNVLLGNGAGGFAESVSYPVGLPSTGLASADFNNDGELDLAVLSVRPMKIDVSILLGDGMGGFNAPTSYSVAVTTGDNFQHVTPESFVVADFNGDGKPDVAVGYYFSSGANFSTNVAALLNNGSGALLAPMISQIPAHFYIPAMVAGDFDGDGKNDILSVDYNGITLLSLWSGNGMGGFSPLSISSSTIGGYPEYISAGDFNADGRLDVAVAREGSYSRVLLNTGTSVWTVVEVGLVGGYGSTVADFNGDGKLDVIIGSHIFLGNGLGGFSAGDTLPYTSDWGARVYSGDFNNDGKIDVLTVDNGWVMVLRNWCGQLRVRSDYDGDGKADIAVFRPSNGNWYYLRSSDGVIIPTLWASGSSGDVPVPGNYDHDSKTDFAVFTTNGVWHILNSSDGSVRDQPWGLSGDKPVPADYDGDWRTDIAVYRPSTGVWYVLRSSDGTLFAQSFGVSEDKPVPADYDGDGRADVAVYRPSVGSWYIFQSSNNTVVHYHWGLGTDIPAPADYNGDGRAEITVFRQSEGTWVTRRQDGSADFYPSNMGGSAALPQPADYDGGGFDRRVAWRPADARWWDGRYGFPPSISFSVNFGVPTDIPVSSPAALNQ
jgi:hypothetical protein